MFSFFVYWLWCLGLHEILKRDEKKIYLLETEEEIRRRLEVWRAEGRCEVELACFAWCLGTLVFVSYFFCLVMMMNWTFEYTFLFLSGCLYTLVMKCLLSMMFAWDDDFCYEMLCMLVSYDGFKLRNYVALNIFPLFFRPRFCCFFVYWPMMKFFWGLMGLEIGLGLDSAWGSSWGHGFAGCRPLVYGFYLCWFQVCCALARLDRVLFRLEFDCRLYWFSGLRLQLGQWSWLWLDKFVLFVVFWFLAFDRFRFASGKVFLNGKASAGLLLFFF